jgi:hypothetical protein
VHLRCNAASVQLECTVWALEMPTFAQIPHHLHIPPEPEPDLTALSVISLNPIPSLHALTFGDAHDSIPRFVSLWPLSLSASMGTPNGCSQCRVSVRPSHRCPVDSPPGQFGSNLSGPFFLFGLTSVPGQLVMRIARPAPYLNMGNTWTLRRRRKYKGTGGR